MMNSAMFADLILHCVQVWDKVWGNLTVLLQVWDDLTALCALAGVRGCSCIVSTGRCEGM